MSRFYAERVFPLILEKLLGNREIGELRRRTLAPARGRTLEIGFGTALNLEYYPESVDSLTVIDSESMLEDLVTRRIAAAPIPVTRLRLDAQGRLPFDDGSFDSVVTTFTLCSIGDLTAALHEARRVLAPRGELIFLEHGRSNDPRVACWQDRLNPLQKIVGVGCNLNRKIDLLLEDGGFSVTRLERSRLPGAPRLIGEIYLGVARIS